MLRGKGEVMNFSFSKCAKRAGITAFFAVCLFCLRPEQTKAQQTMHNDDYTYCYNEECAGIEIVSYDGIDSIAAVPEEIDGIPVKVIGTSVFLEWRYWQQVKEVIVPDSVVEIKDNAFLKCSAEKIVLPENLKKMGVGVFMDCKNLKTVELPDCLTEIPEYSFHYSGIEKIVIPRNVRILGSEAFAMCGELKEVVFEAESNLKEIGTACFWDCGKLKKISIPGKVKKIKNLAFDNCKKLRQILFFGAVPKFGGGAFCNIDKKAVFKVPAKYKSKYAKKLNKQTGYLKKTMRIKTM